jgi:glycosyltransferase involved in cell wall biosynthesis
MERETAAAPADEFELMRTAVFSIISPNYRHYARVLMASLARHHPQWERFVLLAGGTAGAGHVGESFTTVPLEALPLPNRRQFCFRYTLLELNTAVKPWMFEHLFARGYDRVIYLDPDVFLYSPLVELDAASPAPFLTLTPHLTGSISGDDHPSERSILLAGVYNLGFLSVSRQPPLDRFLGWWKEKLEYQCLIDTARGLFVDQKWVDLAPGLFPGVSVLRHEGYNVAYWNLGQRRVAAEGGGATEGGATLAAEGGGPTFTVNGQALRFFHFSGFDPALPHLVSKHGALKVADAGDARKLIEDYALALRAAGYESFKNAPYALGVFADGAPVPDAARIAYRNSATLQSACGPDPFAHSELFLGIRDEPRRVPLAAKAGVASYRLLSRAGPLVRLIPRPLRTSMRELLLGRRERRRSRSDTTLPAGLNVVGYPSRNTGVGESARLCRNACQAVGLPSHLIDVDRHGGVAQHAVYRASVYHVNADQISAVRNRISDVFDAGAYNIGCWHWELPELPDAWVASAEPLDEIWAPSAFVQSAISRKVTIPVVHMPHGIEVTEIDACAPEELGVPAGRFTFLCMFDRDSVVHRKNPLGAVEAFRRAFPAQSSAALLIKTSRAAASAEERAELEDRVRGIPNVYLTDRMLSRGRVNGLVAACDAVVSLHHSEGFGLILAEAMVLGKPVVATGWSGNVDFMNSGNSCLVGYELTTLDRAYGPYPAGEQWAEPDLDHAAQLMRRLFEDTDWRTRIGQRARDTIRAQFSPAAAGLRYRRRLAFLGLMEGESGE